MSTPCMVCVRGYPADLPVERVADKLTIHFLRARNGGGEPVNIEFTPESPGCAIVTFTDATVAQRVLKVKKHALSCNGKNYPLDVTAYSTELNPNEIFVRVYMKIDYGRFPNGKDFLNNLCQQYGGIHISFNIQEMTCSVKGSFTELQAFSSELLRSLNSNQRANISPANGGRPAEEAAGDGILHQEETQAEKKKIGKETKVGLLPVKNSVENHVEPLEDFSLAIDSDIYLYIRKFCHEEFSNILHQNQVSVVDVSSDGITTLYLRATSDEAGGVSALVSAHLALSRLSQQLEDVLRKEKISKRDWGDGGLPGEMKNLCRLLLIHEDDEYFFLIGNLEEVSRAKQYIIDLIAAREAMQVVQKPSAAPMAHLPLTYGQSTVPTQLKSPTQPLPRKLNSPRPNSKTEHKLAAKFSSEASISSFSSQDTPLGGLHAACLFQTAQHQAPDSKCSLQSLAATTEPGSQIRQPAEFWKAPPQGMKANLPPATSGGNMSSSESQISLGLVEPSSVHAVTGAFRSLNLFDNTGTVDFKGSEPKSPLRRASSLLLQKPQNSSESTTELPTVQVSMDCLKQDPQQDTHYALQKEIRKEGMTQMEEGREVESPITKQRHSSSPLLTVQRNNGRPSGMLESKALSMPHAYIPDSFTYTELALDGPEDKILGDLCSCLKNIDNRIIVSRNRYNLNLTYPYEVKLQVLELFHLFSAQRAAALTEQIHSHDAQEVKIQDETSCTRSPQQIKESWAASLLEKPPGLDSLARETLSSQVPTSTFQPAVVQNFPTDQRARPSENLVKKPNASKLGSPRKPIAEVRQGLPDKFHFARDCRKEESVHEAERNPGPLPSQPLSISPARSMPMADKNSLTAGEDVASDLGLRSVSTAKECELCQNNTSAPTRAPCTHKPYRTNFSSHSTSPPYYSASPAIPGTFAVSTISQSLPGFFRDLTLKITYEIPDGVQHAGHPHPGHTYIGGCFEAFLPDNPEGRRLMVLLHKAFQRGLTFQIKSCGLEERVTWGPIPHKTAMEGGRARSGYPDAQYLQRVSLKLKDLNVE